MLNITRTDAYDLLINQDISNLSADSISSTITNLAQQVVESITFDNFDERISDKALVATPDDYLAAYLTLDDKVRCITISRADRHTCFELLEYAVKYMVRTCLETSVRYRNHWGSEWRKVYSDTFGSEINPVEYMDVKIATESEVTELHNSAIKSSRKVVAITEEQFYDQYESLPPLETGTLGGMFYFLSPEFYTGTWTTMAGGVKVGGISYYASVLVDVTDESTRLTPEMILQANQQ